MLPTRLLTAAAAFALIAGAAQAQTPAATPAPAAAPAAAAIPQVTPATWSTP